ncbi:glycosyltransferase family 2 protein [Haloarchaeobius iranensis]|uniref:Glycosyltransferase involved in cell wall bisynthesis n=1 Tax=Haloarchaeobius iranensis TaxID=996166 RepID=A0A1H0BVM3_9EURY|nr:glycosyltransferase family 2 protein [Haloarchaeobius iranensis]SDN49637.1 Glycosyltransferase involved in cell wall bisynthesis [Haloarchaeobius iranensis]
MTEDPLVSIVIPTYYRNHELVEAIESVEEQSYSNVETIVVDDSGERNAESVVEGRDIKYIAFDENRGAQSARMEGIETATGKFVQLLDDDDRLQEDKLKKQVALLREEDDVGVVYSGFVWKDGGVVLPNKDIRGDVLKQALTFKMAPCITSTMLIQSSLLEEVLPFKDRPGADDIGFKIELALRTEFDFVDEPLVIRRDSEGSRGKSWGSYEGRLQILEDYEDVYEHRPASEYKEAKAYTELQRAEVELSNSIWSFDAILAGVRMCLSYPRVLFFCYLASIVWGRPGYVLGRKIYSTLLRDDVDRGKI